jgi:membrane protein
VPRRFAGFLLVAIMFGLIYKVMPRQRVLFSDVWLGALIAALLFTGGKFLIGAKPSSST